jgi:microcystin degradation protein MlrC
MQTGPAAWLALEGRHDARIDVIVTVDPRAIPDFSFARALGVEPLAASCVIVKSAVDVLLSPEVRHFGAIIPAVTPGITSSDLAFFPYARIPSSLRRLAST